MKRHLLVLINITFIVFLFPKVHAQTNQTVVSGASTTTINFPGNGCVYNWVNDTPGIGLAASGIGDISSFKVVNTSNNSVTATITATPFPSGFAYIENSSDGTVSIINTATNSVISTISVGSYPLAISVSPDNKRVYVVNTSSNTISVINTATNTVIGTISAGISPNGISVSPDGSRLYVTNATVNTVSVIDVVSNSIINTINVGSFPIGVSVSPDGTRLFVANLSDNTVSVINTTTNLVMSIISVGIRPTGIAVSPDGSRVYVSSNSAAPDGTISVINTLTNSVIATVIVGAYPYCISMSPDGSRLYVANNSRGTISVINTATNTVITTIDLNNGPSSFGVSLSPNGSLLYVTNLNSNNLSVVSTVTNTVISTITTGSQPTSFGNFVTSGSGCTGSPITFTIAVNPAPASPPTIMVGRETGVISACTGIPSASPNIQQFTVFGSNLTGNISVTAPTGFEVSLAAGSGYSSSVTVAQSSGTVNWTSVYVRSAASAPTGNIVGNVAVTSPGAASQNVAVTGAVYTLPTVNAIGNQTVNNGASTTTINFTGTGNTFNWVNDTPGIGLAASGTGNIAAFTAINTGKSPVKATITVMPIPAVGYAYITNSGDGTVSVIDIATNTVVSTITVGSNPTGVSVSTDNNRVYVSNQNSNSVSAINTSTNKVISTIPVGTNPTGLVVSPDGSWVYVANLNDGTVSVINTKSNTVMSIISVGLLPTGVAISPDGSRIYVTNYEDGTVSVINTATNTVVSTISVGSNPFGITVSPDGVSVYVAYNSTYGFLTIINTTTNLITDNVILNSGSFANIFGISASPDGNFVYIAEPNHVEIIYTGHKGGVPAVLGFSTLPESNPYGLSVSPDGSSVYVVNSQGVVSVIDVANATSSLDVKAYIRVGSNPKSFGNFITGGTGCSGTPVSFTITVDPTPPLPPIITTGTVTGNISGCLGTVSVSPNVQQFIVSGSNLTTDITATAPSGFEVSLSSGNNYSSSVTLIQSVGAVNSRVVYVRSASALPGNISGNVVLTSAGATSQNIAVNGIINATVTPSVSISASVNNNCSGTPVTFTANSTNGGNSPVYQWLINGINTGTNSPSFTSSTLANGDVINCQLTNNAVCSIPSNTISNIIIMNVYPEPVVNAGGNKTIKEGNSTILNATASGNIANITWNPTTGLSNNKILNPTASPASTTTYTLTVQTIDGCIGTDTVAVTVFMDISIPNTFTPNGDGINDTWNIKYLDSYANCTVGIYNRYGEKVYSSIGYGIPWNGTYKGASLPTGPYYYIINLKNGLKVLSGNLTIIR
ncbi:MAG: beta-propeller fold lactonase family protein [Mucilaginibacter sp.]|nr:beta-propeller fold lactonase family protein [Mucilaginibacter sp.]